MSMHCVACSEKSWENCKDCSYAERQDEETLYLFPSGLIVKKPKD